MKIVVDTNIIFSALVGFDNVLSTKELKQQLFG
jgi:predicted nucleic acid-binding protein